MSVRRKLFLTLTAFITGMGLMFVLLTQFVVVPIIDTMMVVDRTEEVEALSAILAEYYLQNDQQWKDINLPLDQEIHFEHRELNLLLLDRQQKDFRLEGGTEPERVIKLGIQKNIEVHGTYVGSLYYYDAEVARTAIIRQGIVSSVTTLLMLASVLFVLISLVVAYRLSTRLTRPLQQMIPPIEKLAKGEYGVQAPIVSRDEYATVTRAFNQMSRQLLRAEETRRQLTADVAHELRTPLTILSGKLDYIQQNGKAVSPESLLPLQDELLRLTRLVEDLRLLSLAEAKKLPLNRMPTDLTALLYKLKDRLQPLAEESEISLTLSCAMEETEIHIDPHRLTQVFLNLLMNAFRYTPAGGKVEVLMIQEKENNDEKMIAVTIRDTGIGIAPEHVPHLFDRFYRTDPSRARDSGGTGLGLAIAQEYVRAHGGTIEVQSNLHVGTSVIVRLPL